MVLRPGSEHVRQRAPSLHLAVPAVFPLHALHGQCLRLVFLWVFTVPNTQSPSSGTDGSVYYMETMQPPLNQTSEYFFDPVTGTVRQFPAAVLVETTRPFCKRTAQQVESKAAG